jgi:hypothetical protein
VYERLRLLCVLKKKEWTEKLIEDSIIITTVSLPLEPDPARQHNLTTTRTAGNVLLAENDTRPICNVISKFPQGKTAAPHDWHIITVPFPLHQRRPWLDTSEHHCSIGSDV